MSLTAVDVPRVLRAAPKTILLGGLAFLALAGLIFLAVWVGGRAARQGGGATVAAGAMLLLTAAFFVGAPLLQLEERGRARLAADRQRMAALRSATRDYHGQHATYPTRETLQTLVDNFDGALFCPRATWSVDATNGRVTYAPNDVAACR